MNKAGPALLPDSALMELSFSKVIHEYCKDDHFLILDLRSRDEFSKKSLPGALNIPFDESFTNWAGSLIDYDKKIILITDKSMVHDVRISLQSIGLDNVQGFVTLKIYEEDVLFNSYENIDPLQLKKLLEANDIYLIDVRNQNEWDEGNIESAHHIVLSSLEDKIEDIPRDKTIVLQCRTGRRSAIGVSLLKLKGFNNVLNLEGGIQEWQVRGLPLAQEH